jgi:hypothetical protein
MAKMAKKQISKIKLMLSKKMFQKKAFGDNHARPFNSFDSYF